jgi:Ulp1 family protease
MIPINFKNSHWSLVTVDLNERKLDYYDSLDNTQEAFKIMESLAELFTEYITRNKEDVYNLIGLDCKKDTEDATLKLSNSFTSNINDAPEQNPNSAFHNININKKNELDSQYDTDAHAMNLSWRYKIFDTPKQMNGTDCGVFMCKYIDYISRNKDLTFNQPDIKFFRFLMGVELMEGRMIKVFV